MSHTKMKAIKRADAVAITPDGVSLMVGVPARIIGERVRQGRKHLRLISNDTARPGVGVGKLIDHKMAAHLTASHIGTNPETQRQTQPEPGVLPRRP